MREQLPEQLREKLKNMSTKATCALGVAALALPSVSPASAQESRPATPVATQEAAQPTDVTAEVAAVEPKSPGVVRAPKIVDMSDTPAAQEGSDFIQGGPDYVKEGNVTMTNGEQSAVDFDVPRKANGSFPEGWHELGMDTRGGNGEEYGDPEAGYAAMQDELLEQDKQDRSAPQSKTSRAVRATPPLTVTPKGAVAVNKATPVEVMTPEKLDEMGDDTQGHGKVDEDFTGESKRASTVKTRP